jgi:hypothetical protein
VRRAAVFRSKQPRLRAYRCHQKSPMASEKLRRQPRTEMVGAPVPSNRKSFLSNLNEYSVLHHFHRQTLQLRHRIHDFVTTGLPAAETSDCTFIGDFDAEPRFLQLLNDNCFHGGHSDFAIDERPFSVLSSRGAEAYRHHSLCPYPSHRQRRQPRAEMVGRFSTPEGP